MINVAPHSLSSMIEENSTHFFSRALRVLKAGFIVVALFFGTSASTHTAEIDTTAAVNLLLGLTVTEDREIDFGSLNGNSAGNCTMALGGALSGTATGCTGIGTSAQFTVTGIRFFQVNVSVLPGSLDGITFTPTFGPSTSLSGFLPPTSGIFGSATLEVAGQLSWGSTLLQGTKVIPYTFVADYN